MGDFDTVDEAMAAGRPWLAVRCDPCRRLKHVPWRLLPGVLGHHKIADIAVRLRCARCGGRPSAVSVAELPPASGYSHHRR